MDETQLYPARLNKKKKFFLTESKEQNLNLKQIEITPFMKWAAPFSTSYCSI